MFFTEKKLGKMSAGGRIKKALLLIQEIQEMLLSGESADSSYLKKVLTIIEKDISKDQKELFFSSLLKMPEALTLKNLRDLSNLKYLLLAEIGKEPADWNIAQQFPLGAAATSRLLQKGAGRNQPLASPDGERRIQRETLPINVYLDDLRSPFNVGSIFRTAESFCYENIFLSSFTPSPAHKRATRSSMGTTEAVKWSRASVDNLPQPVFVLETGGRPVSDFAFPESGTVIIGSEESGVSNAAIETARKSLGVVSIPLYGVKGSLNVGIAFGILSFCWVKKLKT
ncbi:MAG: TrmH family RNA methyltransferase [Spirochaetes bacterium]|nr:TrmH family RNA methyltransferase [Spirochaetota bacterium]